MWTETRRVVILFMVNNVSQVEALLAKIESGMPPPNSTIKQHEAFLNSTKTLLHPGNYMVRPLMLE